MQIYSRARGDLLRGRGPAASRRAPHLFTGALAGALTGALALGAPPLAAQGSWILEGYAARKEPSASPIFGGLSVGAYRGVLGIRLNGALHIGQSERDCAGSGSVASHPRREGCRYESYADAGGSERSVDAWSGDADIVFEPLRSVPVLRSLLLGFSPYGFAGVGRYVVKPAGAPDTNVTTWSYGAGVRHRLIRWLGVSAEARWRRPLSGDDALTAGWRRAVEYRAGVTVSLGGRRPRAKGGAPRTFAAEGAGAAAALRVLALADRYVDTPYRRGGTSPGSGFDAAGFVQYVFGRAGVELPPTAGAMAEAGERVSTRAGSLRPGDLLLFASDGSRVDHVAIYVGRDRIVHASASGGDVRYDVLGDGARGEWFADHLVGARRVVGAERDPPPNESRGEEEPDRPDRAPRPDGAPR